jgi:hypothetical protein
MLTICWYMQICGLWPCNRCHCACRWSQILLTQGQCPFPEILLKLTLKIIFASRDNDPGCRIRYLSAIHYIVSSSSDIEFSTVGVSLSPFMLHVWLLLGCLFPIYWILLHTWNIFTAMLIMFCECICKHHTTLQAPFDVMMDCLKQTW